MVYPSGMKRKKLNLSSLPITLKYGGMQGKIAESTFKSQRTRFLSSQPTDSVGDFWRNHFFKWTHNLDNSERIREIYLDNRHAIFVLKLGVSSLLGR